MPPSCPPEAAWHRQACHEVRGLQQAKWASDVAARHGGGHLSNRYLLLAPSLRSTRCRLGAGSSPPRTRRVGRPMFGVNRAPGLRGRTATPSGLWLRVRDAALALGMLALISGCSPAATATPIAPRLPQR